MGSVAYTASDVMRTPSIDTSAPAMMASSTTASQISHPLQPFLLTLNARRLPVPNELKGFLKVLESLLELARRQREELTVIERNVARGMCATPQERASFNVSAVVVRHASSF